MVMSQQASVGDAETMTNELLKTEKGQRKFKYEQQMKFGAEMHDSWAASGSGIQQVRGGEGIEECQIYVVVVLRPSTKSSHF
jgi:hypothetical protein